MTDERYPETDEDPGPLDGLVGFLRDVDATHQEKAIALLGAARREFQYAVEDGDIAGGWEHWNRYSGTSAFLGWAQETLPKLDAAIEAAEAETASDEE